MPGTSERSFIAAFEDMLSLKFCQYELHLLKGLTWMDCPSCNPKQVISVSIKHKQKENEKEKKERKEEKE